MYGSFARMSDAGSVAPSYDSSIQIIPAPPAEPIEVVVLDPEDDDMEVDAAIEGADGDSSDETDPSEDPAWAPAGGDVAAVADLPVAEAPQADLPLVPFQAAPLPVRPIRAVRDFPVGYAGPSRPAPTQSETVESPFDRHAHVDREPLPTPHIPVPPGMRLVPVARGHNGWISDDSDDESTASVEHITVPIPPADLEEHVAPMIGHATTAPAALLALPEPVPQDEPASAGHILEGSSACSSELHRVGLAAHATASPPTPTIVISAPEWVAVTQPLMVPLAELIVPSPVSMTLPITTFPTLPPLPEMLPTPPPAPFTMDAGVPFLIPPLAPYTLGAGDPYQVPPYFFTGLPGFAPPFTPYLYPI